MSPVLRLVLSDLAVNAASVTILGRRLSAAERGLAVFNPIAFFGSAFAGKAMEAFHESPRSVPPPPTTKDRTG